MHAAERDIRAPKTRMPSVSFLSLLRSFACALSLLGLAGCSEPAVWDHEYVCKGLERSTTHLQAHPETENYEKSYPITIDFHVRSGLALVKSHQVSLQHRSANDWGFQSQSPASWASGSFNDALGTLSLVESQVLIVDGVAQETRTTGQYACVGAGKRKAL
jgi:hypothetical protein